ncbi:Arginase/deacetylase [Cutaneotrichosporon oleaginosum]|uniref:Arginase/deacetylase n=1 Tax=Cutaneotrichosporon oleaginosum TaxID=879819 RepID=A0A0J0XUT6_9TREE|nr:Arginase/deacetylase [Cutaneotrichosporon oleaginosum]KLT44843.1 Arginase/deacetylase [Cutaneotrichosporon oleaginosum]TXT11980.1 hypothetical protein COLE_02390 [Cutaneotrichosporon oleaginosum]
MSLAGAPPLALHIQPACLEHKYIRHKDASHIFERPERLRAVLLGFAAALARLEAIDGSKPDADDLSALLGSLSLSFLPPTHLSVVPPPPPPSQPGRVLLHHPALQLAHSPPIEAPFPYLPNGGGAMPQSAYLKDLFKWASEALETIRTTGCEIPTDKGLNAGDLYLGPGSVVAIEGAIQTVCQAVDGVCSPEDGLNNPSKAFCAIRPPGHHCGEDEPSGFCYVNNVVVGAMHAYLQHDVDRAIIIDFDLHHGNGTQALVMPLNAASYSEDLAVAAGKPPSDMRGRSGRRRTWKGFYGSVHDIYSYPCEDGDLDLIRDASVNLAAHGQYIENIHLQPYEDEADFYKRIYPLYLALLDKARVFMRETQADPAKTVLFISAGFDACEHEHQGMQRHDRRVPASFYTRYTRDIAAFADAHTDGKVISVLEGGYSDRALTSAALGHAVGLMGREGLPEWCSVDELVLLERAVKKRRKGKLCSLPPDLAAMPHIARTHAILAHWEGAGTPAPSVAPSAAPSANATPSGRMTLRERRPKEYKEEDSPLPAPRRRQPKSNAATPKAKTERESSPTPMPTSGPSAAAQPLTMTPAAAAYPSPAPSAPSPDEDKPGLKDLTVKDPPSPSAPTQPSAATQNTLLPNPPHIVLRIPARTPEPPESQERAPVLRIPARTPPPPHAAPPPAHPAPALSRPAPPPLYQVRPAPPPSAPPQPPSGSFRAIAPQAVSLPPMNPGMAKSPESRISPVIYAQQPLPYSQTTYSQTPYPPAYAPTFGHPSMPGHGTQSTRIPHNTSFAPYPALTERDGIPPPQRGVPPQWGTPGAGSSERGA